jgi:hypothetical protein
MRVKRSAAVADILEELKQLRAATQIYIAIVERLTENPK